MTEGEQIDLLIDSIEREKVARARRMTPEQRLWLGGELFDGVFQRMWWALKGDHPSWSDDQIFAEIRRRLTIARKIENTPWTRPLQTKL